MDIPTTVRVEVNQIEYSSCNGPSESPDFVRLFVVAGVDCSPDVVQSKCPVQNLTMHIKICLNKESAELLYLLEIFLKLRWEGCVILYSK